MDFLKKDFGGLPGWVWIPIIGVGGVLGYLFVRSHQAASTTSTTGTDTTTPGTTSVVGDTGTVAPPIVIVQGQQGPTGTPGKQGPPGPRGPTGPIAQTHVCPPGHHWDVNATSTTGTGGNKKVVKGMCVPDKNVPHKPPMPPSKPTKPIVPTKRSYIVRSGDTLFKIASFVKVPETTLYNSNKTIIESTAKAHGYKSSNNGNWIFPGEVLVY